MWVPNLPITLLSAAAATAGIACIVKDVCGGVPFDREVRADGQTVVVTGANAGIGRQAALGFASRGAKVFMACRDMAACEAARREIVLETNNRFVYCRPCDLASTDSVRDFAATFKSEEPNLHVLVCNAGVLSPPARVTRDGFEAHLGINHLGHFLLTNLLLDTLKESSPSRVVVVTASSHRHGRIEKDDLNLTKNYDANAAYAQSKLANLLFASELGRRTLGTGVSVIAVDPGLTDTDLTRNMSMTKSITRFFIYPFFWPFMKTPTIGAQVVLHAALDPKLNLCTGDLYVDMKKAEPSEQAKDFELAQWLWRTSEKWTRLQEHQALLGKARAA